MFRYSVPTQKSLRVEWLCCVPDGDGREAFRRYAGYHEEISIDPESGAGYDFSGLEIGHLGHIYEGLLSLRLSVADRPYRRSRRNPL